MTKKYLFVVISILVALLVWFIESMIHYFGFGEPRFEFVPSDFNELWMRCIIVVLIVTLGVFADSRRGLEKEDVYRAMLGATNHILNNHLQKMVLFHDEAENSQDFDRDILKQYDRMIAETVAQIRNLDDIQAPNKVNIEDKYRPK